MVILDIRTPAEYAAGHLPGAILVPTPLPPLSEWQTQVLRDRLQKLQLDPRLPVYVYCKKGVRAKLAVDHLRSLGFEAMSLGGVEGGWLSDQLEAGYLRLVQ